MKPEAAGPDRALRVCIVTDAYLPGVGGIENHTLHLAAELQRRGHTVVVATHQVPTNAPRVEHQVRSPVPEKRLPGLLLLFRDHDIAFDPRMLTRFTTFIRDNRFDIIHGQSEGSGLVYVALAIARLRGIPTVLTRHSILQMKPGPMQKPLMALVNGLCRTADGLIVVSKACASEVSGFRGPVRIIPNGVNTMEFRVMPEVRQQLRRELGYSDDDVVVGFLGRLHRTKGVPQLLELFEQASRTSSRVKLLVAGPGPLRPMVEEYAAERPDRVKLLPAQPYDVVPRVLNAMDIFAFPSPGEAFGISLLEAMACGLPVVATGKWGVLDLVVNGESGFLAGRHEEFVERLGALIADAGLRRRVGAAARVRAEEHFSWVRIGQQTVELYRELIARCG